MLRSLLVMTAFGLLLAAPAWAQDSDGDGVDDVHDNCTAVANPGQIDSNYDGYGNACDADIWNDGTVDDVDFEIFSKYYGTTYPHADLNGDGAVGGSDYLVLASQYGGPPGPSGLSCAGTIPCADTSVDGDSDADGVADSVDNCVDQANASQVDSDGDGFGNRCDPDLDNDGVVDDVDFEIFSNCYGTTEPVCDFNGDGAAGGSDYLVLSTFYGGPPGPAGPGAQDSCACTPEEGNCP